MATEITDQLTEYLADAHSIEEQALSQPKRAPDLAGETVRVSPAGDAPPRGADRKPSRRAGRRPSTLKDAMMRMGALTGAISSLRTRTPPGKLAAFAYSFEHLEIGGDEQLKRVATRAGDLETVEAPTRSSTR